MAIQGGIPADPEVPMSRPFLLRRVALVLAAGAVLFACLPPGVASSGDLPTTIAASHLAGVEADKVDWKAKTDAWWKETLPAETYAVCREGGTERPFTGALLKEKHPGVFVCSSCGQVLFSTEDKFDSGTGWPSFSDMAEPDSVRLLRDTSHGMVRTEVRCGRCDAHLGHVFEDGPAPTGLRYCINSVCLLHEPSARADPG